MPTGGALRAGALALAPSVHGRGAWRAWRGPSVTPCLSRAPPTPTRPPLHGKQAKKQQGKMPKKGGKRGAQSRDAGAKGGRPKTKPAAADAVLQQPAAPQPPAKKALLGRPPKRNKPSAVPLVRRGPDRICLDDGRALLTGDSPHDRPPEQLVLDGRREEKAAPSLLPLFAALR